jgi:hypothetical protein
MNVVLALFTTVSLAQLYSGYVRADSPLSDRTGVMRHIGLRHEVPFRCPRGYFANSVGPGLPGFDQFCIVLREDKTSAEALFGKYGETKRFSFLVEFRGYVEITTPEEALAFVRLATSPMLNHVLRRTPGPREGEVVPQTAVSPEMVFQNVEWLNNMKQAPDGMYGIVSEVTAKWLGYESPTVTETGAGFEVSRLIIQDWHAGGNLLKRTREWVGRDGEYRILCESVVSPLNDRRVRWWFSDGGGK